MRVFLREVGDWPGAYQVTHTLLDLAESDRDRTQAAWYTVADVTDLCWICYNLGDWEGVQAAAPQAEELALRVLHPQGNLAETQFWQAVLARRDGDQAKRSVCTGKPSPAEPAGRPREEGGVRRAQSLSTTRWVAT